MALGIPIIDWPLRLFGLEIGGDDADPFPITVWNPRHPEYARNMSQYTTERIRRMAADGLFGKPGVFAEEETVKGD